MKPETVRQRKLYQTSIFIAKLMLLGLVFRAIIAIMPATYGLQSGLAGITAEILEKTGLELEKQGALLIGEKGSYLITQDCLGWKSMAAFTGLVAASHRKIENKGTTLLAGLAAILAANIVRIFTTIYLSHTGIISFEIIHSLFWKWGLTAVVFTAWLMFLRKEN
ncbi:MAG: archaeosortase/exosortase family protein [Candidatus Nanohaloarchaea archaeon]